MILIFGSKHINKFCTFFNSHMHDTVRKRGSTSLCMWKDYLGHVDTWHVYTVHTWIHRQCWWTHMGSNLYLFKLLMCYGRKRKAVAHVYKLIMRSGPLCKIRFFAMTSVWNDLKILIIQGHIQKGFRL
jgi:hypothetical protein